MRNSHRSSLRPLILAALAAGTLLVVAPAAFAGTMGLVFDGPTDGAGKHWGVSSSTASAAQAAGIGILSAPLLQADKNLDIVKQELQSVKLKTKDLVTPFDVKSRWTAKSDRDLDESVVFLVFTTIDPRTLKVGSKKREVDYDPTQTGLRVDSSAGWVLLQTSSPSLGTLYYPAVRLGPMAFKDKEKVNVPYYLQELVSFKTGKTTVVALPQLRIGVALAPIPEPGTALLLAVGVIGLAIRSRTRS